MGRPPLGCTEVVGELLVQQAVCQLQGGRGRPPRAAHARARRSNACHHNPAGPPKQVSEKQAQLAELSDERSRLHRRAAVVAAAVRQCAALSDLAHTLRAADGSAPSDSSGAGVNCGAGGAGSRPPSLDTASPETSAAGPRPPPPPAAGCCGGSGSGSGGGGGRRRASGCGSSEDEVVGELLERLGMSEDVAPRPPAPPPPGPRPPTDAAAGAAPRSGGGSGGGRAGGGEASAAPGARQRRRVARQWERELARTVEELAPARSGGGAGRWGAPCVAGDLAAAGATGDGAASAAAAAAALGVKQDGGEEEQEAGGEDVGPALEVHWWPAGAAWAGARLESLGELQAAVRHTQHRLGCLLP
jgi:hypothetical protein